MASLSQKDILEFQRLYKKEFGEEISTQDATERASRLLNLYRAVYTDFKPLDKKK